MVATAESLEVQVEFRVRSTVAPVFSVPMAMNWAVWPAALADWVAGEMASEVSGSPTLVTVTAAGLLVMSPVKPCMLAVIWVRPVALPPVIRPELLTLATAAMLVDHFTWLVTSTFVAGCDP
jgi:hypothetical protein